MNNTLGLKNIPKQFVQLFLDKGLQKTFFDAKKIIHDAPSGWELIEEPGGHGIEILDFPVKSVKRELSESEEKIGQEALNNAYKKIDLQLKHIDEQMRSTLRTIFICLGFGLVLVGVTIIVIAFFKNSGFKLIGKEGVASFLILSGIAILWKFYFTGLKMRTLTGRIRAKLSFCMSKSYVDAQLCFSKTLEELDNAFTFVRNKIESNKNSSDSLSGNIKL